MQGRVYVNVLDDDAYGTAYITGAVMSVPTVFDVHTSRLALGIVSRRKQLPMESPVQFRSHCVVRRRRIERLCRLKN
jgi:hypothetical protein